MLSFCASIAEGMETQGEEIDDLDFLIIQSWHWKLGQKLLGADDQSELLQCAFRSRNPQNQSVSIPDISYSLFFTHPKNVGHLNDL